jgi:hypothetical protein
VYNAVVGEFLARSRAVKSDPAWQAARQMPRTTAAERKGCRAAFRAVQQARGLTVDAAQSFASMLRKSWVREHLPAQEAQSLGARAFDAVNQWHLGRKGKPRFKPVTRGLHSLASKDGEGALRPKVDADGRLVGLQWGAGLVIPIAVPAQTGRRGKEQPAELAEIEALIAAGMVLSTRIVRTVINGRDTYRMQMVVDGHPPRRHPVGDGRVSFDLGPSDIAVAVERSDGTRVGWVQPLADRIRLDTARLRREQRHLDRQQRAGSPGCFNTDGTHKPGRCDGQLSRSADHTKTQVAELHRRLAGHRKTLHGALANRLFAHGADIACEKLNYVAWQKKFPQCAGPGTGDARRDDPSQGCKRRRGTSLRVQPQDHRPVPNLPVREAQEKAALPTGSPLRVRYTRTSRPVLRLPGTARPNRRGWSRSAGPGGSQHRLAPPSGHRRVPRPSQKSITQPARPQTSAVAEVSGAYQGPA